jgi:hypothetical protein
MVRPFVCLVAMGWRQRASLAMQLGWSLPSSEEFGDAHAEVCTVYTTTCQCTLLHVSDLCYIFTGIFTAVPMQSPAPTDLNARAQAWQLIAKPGSGIQSPPSGSAGTSSRRTSRTRRGD